MFSEKQIEKIKKKETPFYVYDLNLLQKTLIELNREAGSFKIHYALKANSNPKLLKLIKEAGLGADCVSGNEVKQAIKSGFYSNEIVFAGVGKTDKEIIYALEQNIFCFNVESISEIIVINQLASKLNKKASIALRINPHVDALTHKYITTGLEENKFGINAHELNEVLKILKESEHINLIGLHFHIGSQITSLAPFKQLCLRANEINDWFLKQGICLQLINLGGGLGINYDDPDSSSILDFKTYFDVFIKYLKLHSDQKIHFELGRSIVGQCGTLIASVVHVKNGLKTNFAILDAGMTELLRPALYNAYHKIENISSESNEYFKYDLVGPICESSDCFGKSILLPETKRGDLIAIRSTGAYGEAMTLKYNLRKTAGKFYLINNLTA
jgi:diaminopimelate decarboxylase